MLNITNKLHKKLERQLDNQINMQSISLIDSHTYWRLRVKLSSPLTLKLYWRLRGPLSNLLNDD